MTDHDYNVETAEPEVVDLSAEPGLSVTEEQELAMVSKELLLLLRSEAIKRKSTVDWHNTDDMQVFSMAAGVLSNELVDALPGVANITLRSFSTSNKVKYRKMGDYRVFLGPIDRIQTAGDKLLKLAAEYKAKLPRGSGNDKSALDATTPKVTRQSKPTKRKQSRPPDVQVLKQARVEAAETTSIGPRVSTRLRAKPRKSYASLHTVGETPIKQEGMEEEDLEEEDLEEEDLEEEDLEEEDLEEEDLEEVDLEENLEEEDSELLDYWDEEATAGTTPDAIPLSMQCSDDVSQPGDDVPSGQTAVGTEMSQKVMTVTVKCRDAGYEADMKKPIVITPWHKQPSAGTKQTKIIIKSPVKTQKSDAIVTLSCDVCYHEFASERLLSTHRGKHFDGLKLSDTALALHILGLTKHNIEENFTGDLAEQVQAYRDRLKSDALPAENNAESSFVTTEIRVEAVRIKNDKNLTKTEQNQPESINNAAADTNSNGAPGEPICIGPVKKRRGRKSNFEKGLPFTIKGKAITGHEGIVKVDPDKDDSAPSGFKCALCDSQVVSKASLKVHMKNIHLNPKAHRRRLIKQDELKCPVCDFICFRVQNFTRHMKTHSNPDLYMCDKCNYTHKLRAEVLRHKRNAHDDKNFTCEQCGSLHRNQSLLNMHIKLKHTMEYSMVCEKCDKRCSTKAAYREHMAKHTSGELDSTLGQIMCNLCARILPSRNSFEQHKLKFHGDDLESEETRKMNEGVEILANGTFQCRYCAGYANGVAREVRRHILRKHMDRKYQCDQCKASFALEKMLVKHIRIVHYGLEKKKCPECNKWFRNNTFLTQHVKRIHTTEYQCHVCKKQLSDKRTLLDHCELHKPPEERTYRYSCEMCRKKFRFYSNYDYHMSEHTGERPFPCSECDQEFRSKHILDRHMSTHSDDRPFVCEQCRKAFKLKKYLDAHRLTHSGNRHICNLCWKPFFSVDALVRHTCKSYTTKTEPVERQVDVMDTADDRIIENELVVQTDEQTEGGKEVVVCYMCAACQEDFVDADEAAGHVCRTGDGHTQAKVEIIRQEEAIKPAAALTPLSAILVETEEHNLAADALMEAGTVETTALIPEQQFVLLDQNSDELQDAEKLPQMYMCGICNSLFSHGNEIEQHLQLHVDEMADGDPEEMLITDGTLTESDSQNVATTIDEVPPLHGEDITIDGAQYTMVLQDDGQHILQKIEQPSTEEHSFIEYAKN